MKRVLIIRSVSFQQLDKNLAAVRNYFPDAELHLLTHSHGLKRAETYEELSRIIDYGSRKNFSARHMPSSILKGQKYDAVVVPATNKTGTGFLNVLGAALKTGAEKIYMCNLVSEIWEVKRRTIISRRWWSVVLSVVSAILTVPLFLLMLPVLATVSLFCKTKRDK